MGHCCASSTSVLDSSHGLCGTGEHSRFLEAGEPQRGGEKGSMQWRPGLPLAADNACPTQEGECSELFSLQGPLQASYGALVVK